MLLNIIKQLQQASGTLEKSKILEQNKGNEILKDYLRRVYDPSISYYQTKIDKSKGWNLDWMDYIEVDGAWVCDFNFILENVKALANREVTGDKAKEYLSELYSCISPESKELLELLIKRSVGAGVGDTMILNVFPELYFIPPYQRCSLMDDKIKAKFDKQEEFYVQLKLDGSFCYLVKEAGKVPEAITRAGSKYPVEFAQKLATGLPDGFVVVGELLVYGEVATLGVPLDRKTGNGFLNSILKGGDIPNNLGFEMTAWDCITVDEWKAGKSDSKYWERLDDLDVALADTPNANAVVTHAVTSLEDAYEIYSGFTAQGMEGAVIKTTDFLWKDGTSKDCIKLKIEFECDLEVVAITEGTGKASGMMGSITLKSSDGVIVTDCGSGFTDKDREEWWWGRENRIGSIVTVKANDIITKRDNEVRSLFLPIFLEHRLDKTEADTYYRCVEQLEVAKNGGKK